MKYLHIYWSWKTIYQQLCKSNYFFLSDVDDLLEQSELIHFKYKQMASNYTNCD